jgi:KDO2-lipid IV(A) lauroyltransferase
VLLYMVVAATVRNLPLKLITPIQNCIAVIISKIAKERRFLVNRNLTRVYGKTLEGTEMQRRTERTFQAYARYWVDSARMQGLSDFQIDSGFTVEGFEHIENAWETGIGPILALPHLGGWEWAGRWLTCRPNYEVTVVVEPQEPKELFDFMVKYRESFGMNVVPLGANAGKEVINAIKKNHIVCLLCDRDIEGKGVKVNFFGEETTVPAGPATLSIRTGASIIPVAVYQETNSHHATVCPPVSSTRTGTLREDVARISQEIVDVFETLIRAQPEQWHLMQPNWPSDLLALETFRDGSP